MTKKEKRMIESVAHLTTEIQDVREEFVWIAHALWAIVNGNNEIAKYDIESLAELIGKDSLL